MTDKKFVVARILFQPVVAIIFAAGALAETTSSTSTSAATAPQASSRYAKSGSVSLGTSAAINTAEPADFSGSIGLKGKLTDTKNSISFGGAIEYNQNFSYEFTDPEYGTGVTGDFGDFIASASKAFKGPEGSVLKGTSLGLSGVLPLSVLSQKRGLRAGLGPTAGYSLGYEKWSFSQTATYRYMFYRTDIRDNGVVNSPHNMSLAHSLGYQITDKFSAGVDFTWRRLISFQGVHRNQTITGASIGYDFSEKLSASFGVSTLDSTLGPDGVTERITYFDPAKTQASLDVVLGF